MCTNTSIDTLSEDTNATPSESTGTMPSPPAASAAPSRLLALPAELRNQIYEHVINDHHNHRNSSTPANSFPIHSSKPSALLSVNKQIRQETSAMFWHGMTLRNVAKHPMPNQSAFVHHMPKHIAQTVGNAEFVFVSSGFFGSTSLVFRLEHDQYSILSTLGPKRSRFKTLSLAILRYEAWKAIDQIGSWLEKNERKAEPMPMPGSDDKRYQVVISFPPRVIQFDRYEDPLYLRIIGCVAGEIHLFVLRHEKQIFFLRRYPKTRILLLCILCFLGGYLTILFSPAWRVLATVVIPIAIRFLIDTRPWAEQEWILRNTRCVWPTLMAYFLFNLLVVSAWKEELPSVWEAVFFLPSMVLGFA